MQDLVSTWISLAWVALAISATMWLADLEGKLVRVRARVPSVPPARNIVL